MGDSRPPIDAAYRAFGVSATVTPKDGAATPATIIWLVPTPRDVPTGADAIRREMVKALAIRRSEVPSVPRGSTLLAPETRDGSVLGWRVDSFESSDADEQRVIVLRDSSIDP